MVIDKEKMKAFVNIDTDKIVHIPLSHPSAQQTHLTLDLHLPDIRGISDKHYQEIVAQLNLKPENDNTTMQFFAEQYAQALEDGDEKLSARGIEAMFNILSKEFILSDILGECLKGTRYWCEVELNELAGELGLNFSESDSRGRKLDAVQECLDEDSDKYTYMDEYDINGKMLILCTK